VRSAGNTLPEDQVLITVRHDDGSASMISYQASSVRIGTKEKLEVFAASRIGALEDWGALEIHPTQPRRSRSWMKDKGHRGELDVFFKAIREGGGWPISWDELHATAWATLAAAQSLRDGLPMTF
jgi:hypothetical protein